MGRPKEKKEKQRLPEKQSKLTNQFSPKTQKQEDLYNMIERKEVTIATGPAGSGKSYVTLAAALNLLGPVYKKVVLIKSVTTLPGEEIGFIKGSVENKMEPFMFSYKWNVDKMCGENSFDKLIDKKLIEILPLAFVRGITIDDAIVILDEAQNFTSHTFKSIMSRIGSNAKYIFLGDTEQVDMKKKSESFLKPLMDIFGNEKYIGTVEFTDEDCVRNPIIPKILEKLREHGI